MFQHAPDNSSIPPVEIAKKIGEVLEVDWWRFYEDEKEDE